MATVDQRNAVDDAFDFTKAERVLWTGEIRFSPKAGAQSEIVSSNFKSKINTPNVGKKGYLETVSL